MEHAVETGEPVPPILNSSDPQCNGPGWTNQATIHVARIRWDAAVVEEEECLERGDALQKVWRDEHVSSMD